MPLHTSPTSFFSSFLFCFVQFFPLCSTCCKKCIFKTGSALSKIPTICSASRERDIHKMCHDNVSNHMWMNEFCLLISDIFLKVNYFQTNGSPCVLCLSVLTEFTFNFAIKKICNRNLQGKTLIYVINSTKFSFTWRNFKTR